MKKIKSSYKWIAVVIVTMAIIFPVSRYLHQRNTKSRLISELSNITNNDIVFGNENAPASIIMYFDYNCTFCKKFFNNIYPDLDKYITSSRLKLVLRLVCGNNDMAALDAYQTAICINKFGNYKKLHNLLLYEGKIIYTDQFRHLIDDFIIANSDIAECIIAENNSAIKKNNYHFSELNVKGTPTFIIGKRILVGYQDLEKIINTLESEFKVKLVQ